MATPAIITYGKFLPCENFTGYRAPVPEGQVIHGIAPMRLHDLMILADKDKFMQTGEFVCVPDPEDDLEEAQGGSIQVKLGKGMGAEDRYIQEIVEKGFALIQTLLEKYPSVGYKAGSIMISDRPYESDMCIMYRCGACCESAPTSLDDLDGWASKLTSEVFYAPQLGPIFCRNGAWIERVLAAILFDSYSYPDSTVCHNMPWKTGIPIPLMDGESRTPTPPMPEHPPGTIVLLGESSILSLG